RRAGRGADRQPHRHQPALQGALGPARHRPVMSLLDDLGAPFTVDRAPTRVVSLVPSLTEAVAVTAPGLLVGATAYCTHPAGLDVPRVGGSKYPSVERILALRPDLVLVNVEENRREDADAL